MREEVAGGWRRLHNEELHSLYAPSKIITVIKSRRMRWAGNITRMGEIRNTQSILSIKPEERRPLGKLRHRWKDNIRMDLREIKLGLEGVEWIHLAQDVHQWRAPVNMVMRFLIPYNAGSFLHS
jgi:hypothetical protein